MRVRWSLFGPSLIVLLMWMGAFGSDAAADPIEIGRIDEVCCPTGVAHAGDTVFVTYANESDPIGLRIYDYTAPATPVLVSEFALGVDAKGVAVEGDYAVIVAGVDGLVVVDVSNPAVPSVVGSTSLAGNAHDVEVAGGVAYVGTSGQGLRIVDVSNPALPAEIGMIAGGASADIIDLAVVGTDVALCAENSPQPGTNTLQIFDASVPAAPSLHHEVELGNYMYDWDPGCSSLATDGALFYTDVGRQIHGCCTPDTNQIRAYSTSGQEGSIGFQGSGDAPAVQSIGASSSLVTHVLGSDGVLSNIDFTNPASPVWVTNWTGSSSTGPYADMSVTGDRVHATSRYYGIVTIDVGNPALPEELSATTPLADDVRDVVLLGEIVYVADAVQGLRVVDVTTPSAPTQVGSLPVPGDVLEIEVIGQTAYLLSIEYTDGVGTSVGVWESTITIVDVSSPASPSVLGSIVLEGVARSLASNGATVLVHVGNDPAGDVHVLDVSNPASPMDVANLGAVGTAQDLAISGSLGIVATRSFGVRFFDLAVPDLPVEVGASPSPADVDYVVADGSLVYAISNGQLQVLDVSDPANPMPRGSTPLGHTYFRDLRLEGKRLLGVATTTGPLVEIDVRDADDPNVVAEYLHDRSLRSSTESEGLLVTGEGLDGIAVYQHPLVPVLGILLRAGLPFVLLCIAMLRFGHRMRGRTSSRS